MCSDVTHNHAAPDAWHVHAKPSAQTPPLEGWGLGTRLQGMCNDVIRIANNVKDRMAEQQTREFSIYL